MFLIQIALFGFIVWLGFYLLQNGGDKRPNLLAAIGLVSYALAIASEAIIPLAADEARTLFTTAHQFLVYAPALVWAGGLLALTPDAEPSKAILIRIWQWVILPITTLIVLREAFIASGSTLAPLVSSAPILFSLIYLIWAVRRSADRLPLGLILLGTVFFGLSLGLFLPLENYMPRSWIVVAMGFDFAVLGVGIAIFDAFEEGHTLKRDMLQSLQTAFFLSVLFGGQVGLAILLGQGLNGVMASLLFASIATGIGIQAFALPLQGLISRSNTSHDAVQDERLGLRATAAGLLRLNTDFNIDNVDKKEFVRLTRRAISHLGDLPKLTQSPLTRLPIISENLAARQEPDNTLARANELKAVLVNSIQRLKPAGEEGFGATEAWRYFNALYFPYVVGLKPNRRRQPLAHLEPHHKQALEWLQTEVPERTLYNWQTAGAELVAQDLWDQLNS